MLSNIIKRTYVTIHNGKFWSVKDVKSVKAILIDNKHRILKKKIEKNFLKILGVLDAEAVVQRCSVKEVFLEISKNSQGNTCARVFF